MTHLRCSGIRIAHATCCIAGVLIFYAAHAVAAPATSGRQIINFDAGWQFQRGDATNLRSSFDDSMWRKLDLPHDWSIEGPFSETNRTGGAGGYLPAGVGWYRKSFKSDNAAGKKVSIEFEGVMANSDVWINGHLLGHRPYGYVSFGYDLTPYLHFSDQADILVVRADNSQEPASRWYAGAGIYRHVHLVETAPVHIERWATVVTTPDVSTAKAVVHVMTSVTNEGDAARNISVRFSLAKPGGGRAGEFTAPAQPIAPGQSASFSGDIEVKNPARWDLDTPVLYTANAEVRDGRKVIDNDSVPFGIREFEFRSDTGFWLNGRNFKINGVCLHQDGSAFGVAVPMSVWERRLASLKLLGANAIRTAHNPPAPEFLDLCDRMGFLVMDEFFDCWTVGKNPFDYHLYFTNWSHIDAADTIRRDRNHPSIILYSVGNEIHDTPKAELAKNILAGLVQVCHENDPTRPVTQALFRPNTSHDYDDGLADMLDVIGTNYRDSELNAAQRAKPSRKIIGTEQRPDRATWLECRDHPGESGQFLWSGIDYLGEALRWPVVAAGSGLLDRTAIPKPMAYERQSWWSDKPMVFIARRTGLTHTAPADPGFAPLARRQVLYGDWTPANSTPHDEDVEIYSNCQEVELLLNGKSLGSKPLPADASSRNWTVGYEPGVIQAIGRNGGKVAAIFELHTAGKPARIALSVDRTKLPKSWDDVATVSATVVDEKGELVPSASQQIHFAATGPGVIAAVDSADNSSHESFQASERRAYQGRCFAFVKSTAASGRIIITATAEGLGEATVELKAAK